jgi:hypothetical protein
LVVEHQVPIVGQAFCAIEPECANVHLDARDIDDDLCLERTVDAQVDETSALSADQFFHDRIR